MIQNEGDFEAALTGLIAQFDAGLVDELDSGRQQIWNPFVRSVIQNSEILPLLEKTASGGPLISRLARASFLASSKCGNLRNLFLVNFGMVGEVLRFCSRDSELARQYLELLHRGEVLGALAITEKTGGTDHSQHATIVQRGVNGDLELCGSKTWITFGACCDFYLVQCKFEGETRLAIVPADKLGVRRESIANLFGNRGSGVGSIVFENVVLTEADFLPVRFEPKSDNCNSGLSETSLSDIGFKVGRLLATASGLGLATACITEAVYELRGRKCFGRPVIDEAGWKTRLTKLINHRNVLRMALSHGLTSYEEQLFSYFDYWTPLKLSATQLAKESSQLFMEACGSRGYVGSHLSNRLFREALSLDLIEGATESLKSKTFVEFEKEMLLGKVYDFI